MEWNQNSYSTVPYRTIMTAEKRIMNVKNNNNDDDNNDDNDDDNDDDESKNNKLCWIMDKKKNQWWWVLLATTTTILSSGYVVEKRRQMMLTHLPWIFSQSSNNNSNIDQNQILQSLMSSFFLRSIRPTLFIGTRSWINSMWAFWKRTHNNNNKKQPQQQRFREIMTMSHDNAQIAIDWEFPNNYYYYPPNCNFDANNNKKKKNMDTQQLLLLDRPVVLILHGINTDTSFGYIRSFMKSCTNHGWIAAGMNLRGYGNIQLTTPRLQHMAYTNDLRNVIHQITSRMSKGNQLFLVGYSLGANIVVKYLGEEGISSTLPKCIAGAVSMGNPFVCSPLSFPWNILIGLGTKKEVWKHYPTLKQFTSPYFQKTLRSILFGTPIIWKLKHPKSMNDDNNANDGEENSTFLHHRIRNNPSFPFETKVGYQSEAEYANEAGSYQYASNVSVPLLIIVASDDTIANHNTMTSFPHLLSNPNIIIVQTKTGGHLGWHTSPSNNPFHIVNWADNTASKFISSLLTLEKHHKHESDNPSNFVINQSPPQQQQPVMISRL